MPEVVERGWRVEWVGVAFGLLLTAACSAETPADTTAPDQAPGRIDIAVGSDARAFGLDQATCEVVEAGGDRFLNVVAPAADVHNVDGVRARPDLLTARLPAELGSDERTFGPDDTTYGATASVAAAEYDGEEYPLLQVIAQAARDGADSYVCKASRDGEELSLTCKAGKVFPWSSPGAVPSGSFEATVACSTKSDL